MLTTNLDDTQHEFLSLLLCGDKIGCSNIIKDLLHKNIPFKDLYEHVLKQSLYDVGTLWETNKISVATEHLSSAIIEAILSDVYLSVISSERSQKSVLLCCVEKEFHQIGIKMVGDMFESKGWDSFFLGSNMPTKDLIAFAKQIKPNVISISLSLYFHLPILETMIKNLRAEFPDIHILVGGQAFRHGGQDVITKYPHVTYLEDLNDIELFIETFV